MLLTATLAIALTAQVPNLEAHRIDGEALEIRREGREVPLLVFHAPPNGRPYFHPIHAPDGRGVLTEFQPAHHLHQTGLYVGFLKVNDRDFFHHRDAEYFRGGGSFAPDDAPPVQVEGHRASWSARYDWLDEAGAPILNETQRWSVLDEGAHYVLDLDWLARAATDVTFAQHEYGGLFLRMPWRPETGGEAINSEAQVNAEAEGQRARWVDVGLPIEGRDDRAHIAILDHPENPRHPATWRVDDQLGVGPAPSRPGPWRIERDESARLRYRLVVYTGPLNRDLVETEWERFAREK